MGCKHFFDHVCLLYLKHDQNNVSKNNPEERCLQKAAEMTFMISVTQVSDMIE